MSKTAVLFPGQGSQSVGMGRALDATFPEARQTFEEANDALGFDLAGLCFEGPEERLRLTEFTQPAIFTVSIAAYRVLANRGFSPQAMAGHSLGEYSALAAAGAIPFAGAVRTVRRRGQLMQDAVPPGEGAMAAVLGISAEKLAVVCRQASQETGAPVSMANLNSPEQTVISGAAAAVQRAMVLARECGAGRTILLPVSAPFHCALMQPAQDALAPVLRALPFSRPDVPIVVNVDAAPTCDEEVLRESLIRQVTGSVRWTESMQALIAEGFTTFVEVGPGRVLSGLLRQIDRGKRAHQVEDPAGVTKLLDALARPHG